MSRKSLLSLKDRVVMHLCKKCNILKPYGDFYTSKNIKSGYRNECKLCIMLYGKAFRFNNKERIKLQTENRKEKIQMYRVSRTKETSLKNKIYHINHRDTILARKRELSYTSDFKNRRKVRRNPRERARKNHDVLYRYTCQIRSCITVAIKKKYTKRSKVYSIVGCGYFELFEHLKLTAIKNYGIWCPAIRYHIDHITPVSLAKTEEDVIKLNHYSNLQLLLPKDNLAKSNKTNFVIGG